MEIDYKNIGLIFVKQTIGQRRIKRYAQKMEQISNTYLQRAKLSNSALFTSTIIIVKLPGKKSLF